MGGLRSIGDEREGGREGGGEGQRKREKYYTTVDAVSPPTQTMVGVRLGEV